MEGREHENSAILTDGGANEQQNNESITMEVIADPQASSLSVGPNAQGDVNKVL